MDVGSWLRSLGLERYEAAFRENEVDASVLSSLTAEDLKDLGVTWSGTAARYLTPSRLIRPMQNLRPPPNLWQPSTRVPWRRRQNVAK
jgi:hypothetical protein